MLGRRLEKPDIGKEQNMLTYEQFEEKIRAYFTEKYPDAEMVFRSLRKNNGITVPTLSLHIPGCMVMPAVHIKDCYRRYVCGQSLESILEEMEAVFSENAAAHNVEMDYYRNYEQVKQTLRLRLINYSRNRLLLEEIPYCRFLDLALVCYSKVPEDILQNSTVTVSKQHLEMWNITPKELFEDAQHRCAEEEPAALMKMGDLIRQLHPQGADMFFLQGIEMPDMYVLSNQSRMNGAAVLTYPGMLKHCSELLGDKFYILPSSVHELILLKEGQECAEELLSMVCSVNTESVAAEEILSDHVYCYDAKEGCLKDLATGEFLNVAKENEVNKQEE